MEFKTDNINSRKGEIHLVGSDTLGTVLNFEENLDLDLADSS